MASILVVEDDASIRDLIVLTLAMEHYETKEADNGESAYQMIQREPFDLVLLDIMLPSMNGMELLQKIKTYQVPVIFLTAKVTLQDKVMGLKLGAEDYITKPFEPMELLARVEVVLRRNQSGPDQEKTQLSPNTEIITYKDIQLYVEERIVRKAGCEISLTYKEFDLLKTFLHHPNIVFSREQLLNQIWGYDYYGNTRTVDMHIKQLREKLALKDDLQTVFKVGYKLRGE